MSRLFVIVVSIFIASQTAAAEEVITWLDGRLARDIWLLDQYTANPSIENYQRLVDYKLPTEADPALKVCLYVDEKDISALSALLKCSDLEIYPWTYVPPVGAHPYGFYLAAVRISVIKNLLTEGIVKRAAAAYRELKPLADNAAEETGSAAAWRLDPPLQGRGVRIGVIDSGFQLTHRDLPQAVAAMDYADYPDTNADVTDLISGHGTHTAGTVFGSGVLSNGRWCGMAPEAGAIYLKIGCDTTSNASTAAVVGAVRAAATWCQADIATMSYGGYDSFIDGSSPEEQVVDWAVGQGTVVFMSAGNEAQDSTHYSGVVGPRQTTAPIRVYIRFVPDSTRWNFNLWWFDSADTSIHTRLTAQVFDDRGNAVPFDEMAQVASPRGTEAREYISGIYMPPGWASFTILITNHSDQMQRFHILNSYGGIKFAEADPNYTVALPSTADSCISVGSYTSRTFWHNFAGEEFDDRTSRGAISFFSSRGPRTDGYLKPDIAAPGQRVISCRNTDRIPLGIGYDEYIVSNNYETGEPADYICLMGTSMSSPVAAGTAGLMLQSNPDMTAAQLRRLVLTSARTDQFTGRTPNTTWGWGKIDVMSALSAPDEPHSSKTQPAVFEIETVYPNPFNGAITLSYYAYKAALVNFELFDGCGRLVYATDYWAPNAGNYRMDFNEISLIPGGGYMLRISAEGQCQSLKLTALK